MRRPATLGKMLLIAIVALAMLPAHARTLRAQVESVRTGVGSLQQVELVLAWPDGASEGVLEMRVAQLEMPLLSHRSRDLAWRCPLRRDGDGGWTCEGALQAAGAAPGRLSLAIQPTSTRAGFSQGAKRLSYESSAASPDLSRIGIEGIPVAWLQAYLASLWAPGQWTSGTLSGRIDVQAPAAAPLRVEAGLELRDIGLETPDGWLAAAGLQGRLELDYREGGGETQVQADLTTRGGEFLAQGLYAQLPASAVEVKLTARQRGGGPWRLPAFSWQDGQVLHANGSATLDADAAIESLALDLALGDLSVARDRYLSGFLAPAGFADLVLSGSAAARLELQAGKLQAMAMDLDQVTAVDPRQRFILAGLDGDLRWTAAGASVASGLAWTSGALYGIGLGPARFDFTSAGGELRLTRPTTISALGGTAALDHLRWQPPEADRGTRFQLGVTLDALDLGSLSQRLGWPPFTGTLGGTIPAARYADGVLTLDGGLAMRLFGGRISLSELVMERPFGIAPTLSADIAIQDIDMEPMTAAFGFGTITGRLDGRIGRLRMVDWSPVAFDARLQTDDAWKGRRRISQRAVEDISKVGGAGLVAGLQTQVLKLFDDFGYARIGLACRLRDNVCAMDGVGSAGDGYTIVEGSGLPRIQVVGFRRRVDWPTLVARLVAATEGQAPVIQ
jgi:hypothetical protein